MRAHAPASELQGGKIAQALSLFRWVRHASDSAHARLQFGAPMPSLRLPLWLASNDSRR
jgi:hypothetical protein